MKHFLKIFIVSLLILLPVAFLLYCFYPVFTYDTRLSQHVSHPPSESLAPGRILLTDRKGKVITDKAYPNGYYRYYNTVECFSDTAQKVSLMEGDVAGSTEGVMLTGNTNCEFLNALLQIEDKNFYEHWGVNLPAKLRALRDNIQGKKISGGSTITEQYVKNKYFKNSQRGYLQKAREAVLAIYFSLPHGGRCHESDRGSCDCESALMCQKTHILHMYLQDVYFGNQLYGLGAAMEVYFGKQRLSELTQEETTLLISLIHNPGVQSLDETYFQNYFSQVQQRLGYEFEKTYIGKLPKKENIDLFPHVTQKWMNSQETRTSIDAELQAFTQEVIQEELKDLASKNVSNAAVFALNPRNGEILLYIGSKDFHAKDIDGQVDVIQALRQPGSTMKPFLYLQALESGMNPDDLVLDIESEYNSFQEGSVYISENYTLKEYGLVRLKKALGNSFNNASVRLARELGLQKVYEYYKRFGFVFPETAEYYGYSLVLGNASITLESLVRAYAELLDFSKVENFLLYDILSDPDNRDISFGVNSVLNTSIPQAVKTGTSSDFRDNLVVSYHPDFVIGVWVGNNDNSSMQGVTGISGAGYIWKQIIEKAIDLGYITDTKIPIPEGVVQIPYCLDSTCFRKENTFGGEGKTYFSRLAENIYHEADIAETFSDYERERLEQLGVRIE